MVKLFYFYFEIPPNTLLFNYGDEVEVYDSICEQKICRMKRNKLFANTSQKRTPKEDTLLGGERNLNPSARQNLFIFVYTVNHTENVFHCQ